jgi:hypothetical protein
VGLLPSVGRSLDYERLFRLILNCPNFKHGIVSTQRTNYTFPPTIGSNAIDHTKQLYPYELLIELPFDLPTCISTSRSIPFPTISSKGKVHAVAPTALCSECHYHGALDECTEKPCKPCEGRDGYCMFEYD